MANRRLRSNPLENHPKWQKIQDLNSGTFGFVQVARNRENGEYAAIKFLERGDRVHKYVQAEILNHRLLRHPHVIEFKEVFLTPEYICIAMEYASGGNLLGYIQAAMKLKEPAARWFFQQLVFGLDYCHQRGIVNRDLKLENTLLQTIPDFPLPLIKICDFGYSKAHFMSAPKSKVGTVAYMAPEVLTATGSSDGYYDGKLADLWSCGVMLYIMLFGQYPFSVNTQARDVNRHALTMQKIVGGLWSLPEGAQVSSECLDLLSKILETDPRKRLNMDQLSRHPWFLEGLPEGALSMNKNFLECADYSMMQSEEEIKRIVKEAHQAGTGVGTFSNLNDCEDAIEQVIYEEQDKASR